MYFNQLNSENTFEKQHILGIDPIVDGKVSVSYYIKLTPKFN
jgi:hypothetical protein